MCYYIPLPLGCTGCRQTNTEAGLCHFNPKTPKWKLYSPDWKELLFHVTSFSLWLPLLISRGMFSVFGSPSGRHTGCLYDGWWGALKYLAWGRRWIPLGYVTCKQQQFEYTYVMFLLQIPLFIVWSWKQTEIKVLKRAITVYWNIIPCSLLDSCQRA